MKWEEEQKKLFLRVPFLHCKIYWLIYWTRLTSVSQSDSPSVHQSVRPSVRQFVKTSVVSLADRQNISSSARQSVSPSVRQSISPSVRQSVSPSVCHSIIEICNPFLNCPRVPGLFFYMHICFWNKKSLKWMILKEEKIIGSKGKILLFAFSFVSGHSKHLFYMLP